MASSPDNRYVLVVAQIGQPPALEFRVIDMTRNAPVLTIPAGQVVSQVRFTPDSRFLVVGRTGNPGQGSNSSTLLIADLADARVVARPRPATSGPLGPRARCSSCTHSEGGKPVLHAYALATGRQIGEFTSSIPGFSPSLPDDRDLSSWIAPDDRRMAVPTMKGAGPQAELKFFVWQFDKAETTPIALELGHTV